jgi:quinol monooxygenase YgiN
LSSKPYVLLVKFVAKPGEEQALLEWLLKHTEATNAEDGCLAFILHRDPADARTFYIYEQYVDRAAHTSHTRTPHFKAFAEAEIQPRAEVFELTELELL